MSNAESLYVFYTGADPGFSLGGGGIWIPMSHLACMARTARYERGHLETASSILCGAVLRRSVMRIDFMTNCS